MEGMPEAEVPMYKMMGDAAGELSGAAEKKSAGDVMAAMKKVAGSCQTCHAKFKKK